VRDVYAGIYRHYKGPLYLVTGLAHDANAGELYSNRADVARSSTRAPLGDRVVVVYVPLQLDGAHLGPRMAVRTLEDFFTLLHHDDFTPCRQYSQTLAELDPYRRSPYRCTCRSDASLDLLVWRFTYLGPTWEGEDSGG
jgi:hypothetical protein